MKKKKDKTIMPDVSFSQEDILSAGALEAKWYPVSLKTVSEGPGKKDPSSTTWTCEFEVVDGEAKGALVTTWFSSKMMKNAIRFIKCFVPNLQPGTSYPIEQTVGKPVMAYIVYDLDQTSNVIKDFKPVGK